jgi:hypothetical protein
VSEHFGHKVNFIIAANGRKVRLEDNRGLKIEVKFDKFDRQQSEEHDDHKQPTSSATQSTRAASYAPPPTAAAPPPPTPAQVVTSQPPPVSVASLPSAAAVAASMWQQMPPQQTGPTPTAAIQTQQTWNQQTPGESMGTAHWQQQQMQPEQNPTWNAGLQQRECTFSHEQNGPPLLPKVENAPFYNEAENWTNIQRTG